MVNYVGSQLFQQTEVTQQQGAQAPVAPMPHASSVSATASQGTSAHPHSQYRSDFSKVPTVRRAYNSPSASPSNSSCRMVRCLDVPLDGFYQWFDGHIDVDGSGHVFMGEVHEIL